MGKRILALIFVLMLLAGCGSQEVDAPIPTLEEVLNDFLEENPPEAGEGSGTKTLSAEELTADLIGLSIGDFFDQAFTLILERDPELVLEMGMPGLESTEAILTDVSPEARTFDNQLNLALLELLQGYDTESLTQKEQISYQVFEWYLEDVIRLYQDSSFKYLINPVSVWSAPQLYVMFFTDSHPFNSAEDAKGYVARVKLLDEKIDQLISQLEAQEASGVISPKIVLESGRADFNWFIGSTANSSPLRSTFREKARALLDDASFTSLDEELLQALKDEVYPAFDRLDDKLVDLESKAPNTLGVSYYEGGAEYYQRQLEHFTTTNLTAEEIHNAGLAEVARIQVEIRDRFMELGYPQEESIEDLYERLAKDSGYLNGDAITREYERILEEADILVADYFESRPPGRLEVVGGNAGAYYSPGSFDGTRPGKFYALITTPEPIYKMRSLAYHEGIPGHHYQISLAAMADLPLFRNMMGFTGYVEGWALYAEYLAYDLGWYEDDPYGDLGRLQYEALRAVRMVVDTGIHTKGWDYNQAVDYMVENSGFTRGFSEFQIMRYIAFPAQSTAYLVGKNEILRMRRAAEEALGEEFVLKEFHSVILENGSVPLEVLESVIEEWVAVKLSE